MNWTVDWLAGALASLADAYLAVANPQRVTTASDQIDRLLAADPIENAQFSREGLYRLRVPPLTVFDTVDPINRMVEVTQPGYTVS